MSFDKVFDLTAGVYFHFYSEYNILYFHTDSQRGKGGVGRGRMKGETPRTKETRQLLNMYVYNYVCIYNDRLFRDLSGKTKVK